MSSPVQSDQPRVPALNPTLAPLLVCPNKGCHAILSPYVGSRDGFQPDILYRCDNCLYVLMLSVVPAQGDHRPMTAAEIDEAKARRTTLLEKAGQVLGETVESGRDLVSGVAGKIETAAREFKQAVRPPAPAPSQPEPQAQQHEGEAGQAEPAEVGSGATS